MPRGLLRPRRGVVDHVSLATLRRSLGLLLLLLAASCGGGDDGEDAGDSVSVSIASPEDGATVASTFPVAMEATGFTIGPAGEVAEGSGHFHLIVDAGCSAAGETIPADETHVHLDDGASETELTLPAGEHRLCLQAGDGQHTALDLTDAITVTVEGGGAGETETGAGDGEAVEEWRGTYEGEIVWDCGAAGTHRGTVEADVFVFTWESGGAIMDGVHTVSGSCADTGELTTPINVAGGMRTASGFTFPAALWGLPGTFDLTVNGDRAEGRVSGEIPGPATITIDFDLTCTSGC
jgi:Domain of unknown function (DUF4399)